MPYVYIVRCADDTLYTGWAVDVERRVRAHNRGRGARYTRLRGPVVLVYTEEVASRSEALKRERAIKRYPRARKLALCGLKLRRATRRRPGPKTAPSRRERRRG
jgi:predicted GIY-YIG superfamily endonuclease